MSILKLVNAGDSATMGISKAEIVEGNFGEQAKFDGVNGDVLYMPKDSALRQLERLGLGIEDTVGKNVTFYRAPNPKAGAKPFWNLAVEATPTASGPSLGKHVPGLDDDDDLREKLQETGAPPKSNGAPNRQAQNVQAAVLSKEAAPTIYSVMEQAADFVTSKIAPKLGLNPDNGDGAAIAALVNTVVINRTR